MKKTAKLLALALPVILLATTAVSCKYDDTPLRESLEDLKSRLSKIDKSIVFFQVQMTDITDIIEEIQKNNLVESVEQQEDGDWTITFSNGKTVEVTYEKIPEITIPALTVIKDGAKYYWALKKGETVTYFPDQANRIEVNQQNRPQARVNGQTIWEVSFDNGQTWHSTGVPATGEGTDTLFAGVTEDDTHFYITLSDGVTVLPLEKSKGLSFKFLTDSVFDGVCLYVDYGQTATVKYESTGVSTLTVTKPEGWKVTQGTGSFSITAPAAGNTFAETEGAVGAYATGNGQSLIATVKVKAGTK